jgi:hypothetical protein
VFLSIAKRRTVMMVCGSGIKIEEEEEKKKKNRNKKRKKSPRKKKKKKEIHPTNFIISNAQKKDKCWW